jgi:hypothetical protein
LGGLPADGHRGELIFDVEGLSVGESIFHAQERKSPRVFFFSAENY